MTKYIPNIVYISSIVPDGKKSVVTFTENHNFNIGNLGRFIIPSNFGMTELDGKIAAISAITSNTATFDIDTRSFTDFSVPGSYYTPAQIIPSGDENFGLPDGSNPDPIGIYGAFRIIE